MCISLTVDTDLYVNCKRVTAVFENSLLSLTVKGKKGIQKTRQSFQQQHIRAFVINVNIYPTFTGLGDHCEKGQHLISNKCIINQCVLLTTYGYPPK